MGIHHYRTPLLQGIQTVLLLDNTHILFLSICRATKQAIKKKEEEEEGND